MTFKSEAQLLTEEFEQCSSLQTLLKAEMPVDIRAFVDFACSESPSHMTPGIVRETVRWLIDRMDTQSREIDRLNQTIRNIDIVAEKDTETHGEDAYSILMCELNKANQESADSSMHWMLTHSADFTEHRNMLTGDREWTLRWHSKNGEQYDTNGHSRVSVLEGAMIVDAQIEAFLSDSEVRNGR